MFIILIRIGFYYFMHYSHKYISRIDREVYKHLILMFYEQFLLVGIINLFTKILSLNFLILVNKNFYYNIH